MSVAEAVEVEVFDVVTGVEVVAVVVEPAVAVVGLRKAYIGEF